MKLKRSTATVIALALIAICAVGAATALAQAAEPATAGEPAAAAKDKSAKSGTAFVGIDAVAAEVLGVSEESLADLNHADEL